MKIHFADLTDRDLAELIAAAMQEYQRRIESALTRTQGEPVAQAAPVAPVPVPAAAPTPRKRAVKTPDEADQRFIRACLRLVRTKGYVRAAEKDRYRDIVKKHPRWTKINGYPDTLRGSDINRWLDFNDPRDER